MNIESMVNALAAATDEHDFAQSSGLHDQGHWARLLVDSPEVAADVQFDEGGQPMCGTAFCMAGHATVQAGYRFEWHPGDGRLYASHVYMGEGETTYTSEAATALLEITGTCLREPHSSSEWVDNEVNDPDDDDFFHQYDAGTSLQAALFESSNTLADIYALLGRETEYPVEWWQSRVAARQAEWATAEFVPGDRVRLRSGHAGTVAYDRDRDGRVNVRLDQNPGCEMLDVPIENVSRIRGQVHNPVEVNA